MSIYIDTSDVHRIVKETPLYAEFYAETQRELACLPINSMYCIHELGHEIYFKQAGISIREHHGPRIVYHLDKNRMEFVPAGVSPDYKNMDTTASSSIEDFFMRVARAHAAGGVFTLVLTDSPDPKNDSDFPRFQEVCERFETGFPELELNHKEMWDEAELEVARDLRNSLHRKRIWEQVSEIRPKLFKEVKP